MKRLELPDVTLCCVDTRSVPQALRAVQRCMAAAHFGQVIFFGPAQAQPEAAGITWIPIPTIGSIEAYNRFVLKGMQPHIRTGHVLIVQWDGFITHPQNWRHDFLHWDYIGAPWYHQGHPGMVGNGGFSLRSRRLLDALDRIELDATYPEDEEICVHRRAQLEREHGIRFAPVEVARAFACEYGHYRPAFGFHGMHNFAHIMAPPELEEWLEAAPVDLLKGQHARKLVKSLMQNDRGPEAIDLLRRRSLVMGWTVDQCMLYLRIQASRLRPSAD